ncbi:MAG: LPS export ABC transporter permease LptF [Limnohabitans sp.]|jgi:lipopolysaccharide export system permease protein|nr:LPS export ABC transporter permease LptF [Betaproteobacteria bacterium]
MTLFQKSIKQELTRNFGGSTVVLFTIVMTIMLVRIMGQASKGQADPAEIILLIGLNGIGNSGPILTLSLFVSIVYTFSRMYLDSEMVIWFCSGMSLSHFLKPLWKFCWPVILLISLLAIWAWPWSNIQTQYLKDKFESRSNIERVSPGQFQESASNQMVFFVEKKKTDEVANSVYISKIEKHVETITTAKTGVMEWIHSDKFLSLNHGQQTIINHETGEVRVTEFETFKFWLDPVGRTLLTGLQSQMLSTIELVMSSENINRGELFWRLGLFLAAINLSMLAVQLASINPRVGRSYSLALALLCFVGYYNMITIGKRLIADGMISFGVMMLLLHGTASLIILIWYLHTEFNLHWRRFIPTFKRAQHAPIAN